MCNGSRLKTAVLAFNAIFGLHYLPRLAFHCYGPTLIANAGRFNISSHRGKSQYQGNSMIPQR